MFDRFLGLVDFVQDWLFSDFSVKKANIDFAFRDTGDIPRASIIGVTQPLVPSVSTAEELVAYAARVSSPQNQNNLSTAGKLLAYCIKNKHWSVFETVSITMEVFATRDIARQLLRHRSFTFQEFCLVGDSLITFEAPRKGKTGRGPVQKMSIESLYDKWHNGAKPILRKNGSQQRMPMRERLKKMNIRVFDEKNKRFTTSTIKDVYKTGMKPVFKITLENGKTIECTKEHKFLTNSGFMSLKDAVGLTVVGNTVAMSKPDVAFACNGVLAYRDYDWLRMTKQKALENKLGINFIAQEAGCKPVTITKWLRKYGLGFTKKEVATYKPIWNKGLFGYTNNPHSIETIKKMRLKARKGEASNLWMGGVNRSERSKIADYVSSIRTELLKEVNYTCSECGNIGGKLEIHHINPVYARPDLAFERNNLSVVCEKCHDKIHKINGDTKIWRDKSRGNTLTVCWSKIKTVEYIGEKMTYDIEVNHESHNYVANGIVVHNSQRYADPTFMNFVTREARLQDNKNRQNSIPTDDEKLHKEWVKRQRNVVSLVLDNYRWALKKGIAKEQARAVLPEGMTVSHLYVQGTLRSWIHYCALRMGNGTQKEHRELASMCWNELAKHFPVICAAVDEFGVDGSIEEKKET